MTVILTNDEGTALLGVLQLSLASGDSTRVRLGAARARARSAPERAVPPPVQRRVGEMIRQGAAAMHGLLQRRRDAPGADHPDDATALAVTRSVLTAFGKSAVLGDPATWPAQRRPHGGALVLDDEVAAGCLAVLAGVRDLDPAAPVASMAARWLVEQRLTVAVGPHDAEAAEHDRLLEVSDRAELRAYARMPTPVIPACRPRDRRPVTAVLRNLLRRPAGPARGRRGPAGH